MFTEQKGEKPNEQNSNNFWIELKPEESEWAAGFGGKAYSVKKQITKEIKKINSIHLQWKKLLILSLVIILIQQTLNY